MVAVCRSTAGKMARYYRSHCCSSRGDSVPKSGYTCSTCVSEGWQIVSRHWNMDSAKWLLTQDVWGGRNQSQNFDSPDGKRNWIRGKLVGNQAAKESSMPTRSGCFASFCLVFAGQIKNCRCNVKDQETASWKQPAVHTFLVAVLAFRQVCGFDKIP